MLTHPDFVTGAIGQAGWLVPALCVVGSGSLVLARVTRHVWLSFVFLVATLSAGCLVAATAVDVARPAIQFTALGCAYLSFLAAVCVSGFAWSRSQASPGLGKFRRFLDHGRGLALLVGVAAVALQFVLLVPMCLRALAHASRQSTHVGGDDGWVDGAACLALLGAGILASLMETGRESLKTCLFVVGSLLISWMSLAAVPSWLAGDALPNGESGLVVWLLGLAMCLVTVSMATHWRGRPRAKRLDIESSHTLPEGAPWPTGLATSCAAHATFVLLLAVFLLSVPVVFVWGGFRGTALVVAVSCFAAGVSALFLARQSRSRSLADAGAGLLSLVFCAASLTVLPEQPVALVDRYPSVFTALIVGLTLSTAWWTWLAGYGQRQLDQGNVGATVERIIPHAKRAAFLSGALAVGLGGLMGLWPRMTAIATADFSLGRVTMGFGSQLFLWLVLVWSARRLHKPTFHGLAIMALLSASGFMIVRMLPYSPSLG